MLATGDTDSAVKLITATLANDNAEGADPETESGRLAQVRTLLKQNKSDPALALVEALLKARQRGGDVPTKVTTPVKPAATVQDRPAAKLRMAKNYIKLRMRKKATKILEELLDKYPDSKEAKEAEELLDKL